MPDLPEGSYRTPPVDDALFLPAGETLAVAAEGTIHLIDTTSGRERRTLTPSRGPVPVMHLASSPDGATLVSIGWDKSIRLWDVAAGTLRREFPDQPTHPNAVAFSADGRQFAVGMGWLDEPMIRIWDVSSGELVRQIEGHGCYTDCLAFAPDGKLLAAGLRDTTVLIWDLNR